MFYQIFGVSCFMAGSTASCYMTLSSYHRVSGPFPHSKKYLILRSLLETPFLFQWPNDLKIMQISEISELRDLGIYHTNNNEKLCCWSANLPQGALYPEMEGSYKQTDSCWVKLEAVQSLLLVKAKSWIKSDGSLRKEETKQMDLLRKSVGQLKTYLKTHGHSAFCGIWRPNIVSAGGMLLRFSNCFPKHGWNSKNTKVLYSFF